MRTITAVGLAIICAILVLLVTTLNTEDEQSVAPTTQVEGKQNQPAPQSLAPAKHVEDKQHQPEEQPAAPIKHVESKQHQLDPQPSAPTKYVEGTHYQLISTPVKTSDSSKIEVTEVFWYGCGHCNQFRPLFESWAQQQAGDVTIQHAPAIWNKPMIVHAHIFYTAKALRVMNSDLHKDIFDAMHVDKKRLISPKEIFPLLEKYGVTQEVFDKTFDSFGVRSQVQQASARARGYGITGTPEVVVNGKYRVSGRMVGSQAEVLKVTNFLIEKERAAAKKS